MKTLAGRSGWPLYGFPLTPAQFDPFYCQHLKNRSSRTVYVESKTQSLNIILERCCVAQEKDALLLSRVSRRTKWDEIIVRLQDGCCRLDVQSILAPISEQAGVSWAFHCQRRIWLKGENFLSWCYMYLWQEMRTRMSKSIFPLDASSVTPFLFSVETQHI